MRDVSPPAIQTGKKRCRVGECIPINPIVTGSTDVIEDSISVSSDSSEASPESSDHAPGKGATSEENEDTDADDIKIIERPRKKRVRGMYKYPCCYKQSSINENQPASSLEAEDPPAFVQGSSRDRDVNNLARRLEQSASFEERHTNKVWLSGEDADLWNF
jgi:hypothetical protein